MFNKQTLNGYLKYFGIKKLKIYSPRYFIDLVSARECFWGILDLRSEIFH